MKRKAVRSHKSSNTPTRKKGWYRLIVIAHVRMEEIRPSKLRNTEILNLSRNVTWVLHSNFSYKLLSIKKDLNTNYQKMINNVIKQCYFKNSIKIRFEGKGYYLYKNLRNTLAPKFGFAHRIYLYYFLSWVKVLSKTKLLVYDNVKANLLNNAVNLKLLRSRNPFTGRGVRFGRDVRFKKRGKVSSFK